MRALALAALIALAACTDDSETPLSGVVFIGDSITVRLMVWCPDPSFTSAAVSGQTSVDMLARFQVDVLDKHPAVVVINAGTNDILRTTSPSVESIVRMAELAERAGADVVIGLVPPNEDWNPPNVINNPAAGRAAIQRFNRTLRLVAWIYDYRVADYYTALTNPDGSQNTSLFVDGTHPTEAGAAIQCAVVKSELADL